MVLSVTLADVLATRSAVIVPDVVDRATAAAIRARLRWVPYTLVDRGRYAFCDDLELGELADVIARLAGRAAISARAIRLGPGDYTLVRHDTPRVGLEVAIDLSAASVPNAELHYRQRGQLFHRFPCVPGTATIVERTATVAANHSYVSKLHTGAEIVRVIATF
jgi:hypothetical protein